MSSRRTEASGIFFTGSAVSVAFAVAGTGSADYSGDRNRGWIPMLIAGALVLLLSAPLWRATWAFYGVLGFYAPIFHWLTNGVDPGSLGYAFILLAIGVSIFLVAFALARVGAAWLERRRAGAATAPPPPI